jgi:hypothetical protein
LQDGHQDKRNSNHAKQKQLTSSQQHQVQNKGEIVSRRGNQAIGNKTKRITLIVNPSHFQAEKSNVTFTLLFFVIIFRF